MDTQLEGIVEDSSASRTYPANVDEYRQWWSEQRANVPYGFCWCGCGQQTNLSRQRTVGQNYFADEPMRFVRGHGNVRPISENDYTVEDRGHSTPCWVWQRYIFPKTGYGGLRQRKSKGSLLAHRVYYQQANGSIPDGLHIDHLCRVHPCVNPEHMELVTIRENVRRGDTAKLNPNAVLSIRAAEGKVDRAALAEFHEVSPATIYDVWKRRTWKDV